MRLIVARCEVRYTGRLDALLPEALRLIMVKSDGSVMVHADHGGYKPSNWVTPPTVIEELDDRIVVRKHAGDTEDAWVAVEIKRIATIDAVEQLTRYLERIRHDPAMGTCRGVLAALQIKPQARVLAESRGIACVEVDLAVLRGEREPDLVLFASSCSSPTAP